MCLGTCKTWMSSSLNKLKATSLIIEIHPSYTSIKSVELEANETLPSGAHEYQSGSNALTLWQFGAALQIQIAKSSCEL